MESAKILIADDNPEIREIVNILLTGEGYSLKEAKDGAEAVELAKKDDFDLIILDIMMPKLNGYQACLEIRKISNAPILFLTAKSQDSDKTLGFSSGGDDYLPKPFSYSELTARVKALLRRYQVYQGKGTDIKEDTCRNTLTLHNVTLVLDQRVAYVDQRPIELTEIEFQILKLLFVNQKQIFSAERLYEAIWKEKYFYSANGTVMVHIRNLRKKIEKDPQNPKIIQTVWGKGYRCD